MVTVKASYGTGSRQWARTPRTLRSTVTDEDEPGTVTGLPASARVGAELTAVLEDEDGATNTTWQWARAGTVIATSASYTVAEEDAGMSLEITATYDDDHGTGKMVSATVMIAAATVVGQL